MRILHIGDLHFKPKNSYDQNRLIQAFKLSLEKIEKVDMVFFSGDLVYSGTKLEDFHQAHTYLFTPILEQLQIPNTNLFICEGNHDVDWGKIVNAIISKFSDKVSVDRDFLENWFRTEKNDSEISLASSKNFNKYLSELEHENKDIIGPLISIYKREIGEKKVGIVTVNSAWFSADRDDKSELLFLPSKIEEAIFEIKKCDIKIFMQHHPLSHYKESLSFEIQDLVHSNFNILLTGHLHKEGIGTKIISNNGIYCSTTKAALCYDKADRGYSIIETDLNNLTQLKIERYHYITPDHVFAKLDTLIVPLPSSEEKFNQNEVRKKITNRYLFELEQSNLLLLDYKEDFKRGFLDTYTDPVLSKSSDEQKTISDISYQVTLDDIKKANKNYLVFGKDKCGKTSFLKKILLDSLHDYASTGIVALYLDYKQLESADSNFNVTKILTTNFSLNKKDANKIIEDGNLLILLDNINVNSTLHSLIIEFLANHPNIRFIACSEYLASRVYGELDHLDYERLFFKNLGRTEIRKYTTKLDNIKTEEREIIIEKVTGLCKQLQLPVNFWTVSLLILIYKKGKDDYTKNLFAILDSCVDEMLQKKKFLFEKTNLEFDQYKTLCSQIAFRLYKDHKDHEYSASDTDIINIIQDYITKNKRIVVFSNEIFNFLLECGIFKKKLDDNYTFRLNGIFEYFLAYYLKENDDFKLKLLNSKSAYLDFKNELEIYSGFNRSDETFLSAIFTKTKEALLPFHAQYEGEMDKLLDKKIELAYAFEADVKKLLVSKALSEDNKDVILDMHDPLDISSDVHIKKEEDYSCLDVEIVEKYISILARVFKNSDAINNPELISDIFKYLLDSYCRFGFYLIDQYKKNAEEETLKLNDEGEINDDIIYGEEILNLLSRIVPVLVQTMVYDGIGHINVSRIVNDKIKELRVNAKENQYMLFVLYFLLIDIDVKGNKNLIDDIFTEITAPTLKVSTLFKLNFYLAFKSSGHTPIEQFFKNKVQAAELRIDNKLKSEELQFSLARKTKRKLNKSKK